MQDADRVHLCACRYRKAADWQLIADIAATAQVPIIGNGDVLTYYEAQRRQGQSGVHAMMIGRGALIKPWIFQEIKEVSTPPYYRPISAMISAYHPLPVLSGHSILRVTFWGFCS